MFTPNQITFAPNTEKAAYKVSNTQIASSGNATTTA